MKYDIYFHNDFDGRASAAVMLAFLRSRGDDIAHYIAVTYGDSNERGWNKENFFKGENPVIVVDFQYHPQAAWWFDHHATGIKNSSWRKRFKPDARHRLDPDFQSCCHLLCTTLARDFHWKPPRHFKELAKWLDVIDGGNYRSAEQTIALREPALQINAFIEGFRHTARENTRIIALLAERPIPAIAKNPLVADAVRKLKKDIAKSMRFHRKHLQVFKKTTFIDVMGDPLCGLLRFIPYYLYPGILYSIRLKKRKIWWYLGIGADPWRRSLNRKHLGELMGRYGGGGHKNIGAAEFTSKKKALAAFGEVNAILNH